MSGRLPHGGEDPELAGLGQAFRDELRAEAAEYEALAAKDLLRRRRLADVARELVHRGDRVEISVGGQRFTGTVGVAAGDLLVLETAAGAVDLRLGSVVAIRVVEVVRSGGRPNDAGARSFAARLAEHEQEGTTLVLGCPATGAEVHGRVAAVAADHVVVDEVGGDRCYLALDAIGWARPRA